MSTISAMPFIHFPSPVHRPRRWDSFFAGAQPTSTHHHATGRDHIHLETRAVHLWQERGHRAVARHIGGIARRGVCRFHVCEMAVGQTHFCALQPQYGRGLFHRHHRQISHHRHRAGGHPPDQRHRPQRLRHPVRGLGHRHRLWPAGHQQQLHQRPHHPLRAPCQGGRPRGGGRCGRQHTPHLGPRHHHHHQR